LEEEEVFSMNEIDDLLAKLKAEYNQPQAESLSSTAKSLPDKNKQTKPEKIQPLDNLLAEVKEEFESKKTQINERTSKPTNFVKKSLVKPPISSATNSLIQDLQAEYQGKEREEQKLKQEQLLAQQKQQQEKEKRRQQALKQTAKEWLEKLDFNSDEGLWFEEFAYAYESKIEAASDYLQAIRESRLLG
jgi:hypothetical protein